VGRGYKGHISNAMVDLTNLEFLPSTNLIDLIFLSHVVSKILTVTSSRVTPVRLLCNPPLDVSQTNMGRTCRAFVYRYIRVVVDGKEL
jgi:hypothetical protein